MVMCFCIALFCFIMSGVFFNITTEFKKRAGYLPPDIVYEKDPYELESKKVKWQTPKLDPKIWDSDNIAWSLFWLFVLRWGLLGAGIMTLGSVIQMVLKH